MLYIYMYFSSFVEGYKARLDADHPESPHQLNQLKRLTVRANVGGSTPPPADGLTLALHKPPTESARATELPYHTPSDEARAL